MVAEALLRQLDWKRLQHLLVLVLSLRITG